MTMTKKMKLFIPTALTVLSLAACQASNISNQTTSSETTTKSVVASSSDMETAGTSYFTTQDLDASYDEASASTIALSGSTATVSGDGVAVAESVVTISEAGTYIISGESDGVQILIEAGAEDDVQIVLNGVTMTGTDAAIVVSQANNAYITLADGTENTLSDSAEPSNTDYDAVIYSATNLTFNGSGNLSIAANYETAIKSKADLKVAGGSYDLTAVKHTLSAENNLNIMDSSMNLTAGGDAVHADHDEDLTLGNLYIENADLTINATDEGLHATNAIVIASGSIDIQSSTEGIEGKTVLINDGTITVNATDDGIGASDWTLDADSMMGEAMAGVGITINGGDITIIMAEGDTDAVDSNGDLTVTGGTITITGQSAFDFDGTVTFTGGTVIVNGEQLGTIEATVQF